MTSDEVVTEMLRINGQGDSLLERSNMRRVLDYVSSLVDAGRESRCTHLPPVYAGRNGQNVRCRCGKVTYQWRWTGAVTGHMWDVV